MAAIAAVGRPFLHLQRIERGLRAGHGSREEPGRLPRHRISTLWIGHVVVKRQPQARTGAGRTAAGGDPRLVDLPLGRSAADGLQGPGGIGERRLYRRLDARIHRLLDEPVFGRHHGHSGRKQFRQHACQTTHPVAPLPATAMDEEEQRRGLISRGLWRLPKVHHLLGMGAVGDVRDGRRRAKLPLVGGLERIHRWDVDVFIDEVGLHGLPPSVVCTGEAGHDVWMLLHQVVLLARISSDVVEFPRRWTVFHIHEAPLPLANAALAILGLRHLATIPAAQVREQRPVGPRGFSVSQERHEASAFHLGRHIRRYRHAGELTERRQHVDVRRHGRHIDARGQRARPPPEAGHPRAAAIGRALHPAHPGIEDRGSRGRTVVGREHDERVVGQPPRIELLHQPADVRVDVLDHAVELGDLRPLPRVLHARCLNLREIPRVGAGRAVERRVGRVRREIAEERLPLRPAAVDPVDRGIKEDVGAVALGLHERAVAANHRIEIGVPRRVATAAREALPDTAAAVDEDAVEAPLARLVGVFVAQVPLAEDAICVAGRLEKLRQRRGREGQPFAFVDRVGDTGAKFVPAGHERRPGGRAGGARVKLREPNALRMQSVEVRRADDGIAMGRDVAVALVIGHHVDDVRLLPRRDSRCRPRLNRRTIHCG